MKLLMLLVIIGILFLACAPAVSVSPVKPTTNTEALIKAIEKIEIPWNLIRAGERVALVNIETEKSRDYPINYLIEDRLIKKIGEKGAMPVERNSKLIPALLLESNSGVPNSNIIAASKIITYRVLDCGIEFAPLGKSMIRRRSRPCCCCLWGYRRIEFAPLGKSMIRRASAILYIRIEDAKKGNILWLGRVEGKVEDEIPLAMLGELVEPSLIFYDNAMPNVKGGSK